jgi:tetratricopeptide (TPR) repeat protein
MVDANEELPEEIRAELNRLCETGNALVEAGEHYEAIQSFADAWSLIPEPKEAWNAATWVLVALGDTYFLAGHHDHARDALQEAMHCPAAIGNPFIHLRLGQALFELDELDRAADELIRAYMGAGPEIFEPEEPKYLAFLSTRAVLDEC